MRPLNSADHPPESDYARLVNIADAFCELTTDASPAQVIGIYSDYLRVYQDVMEGSLDAHPYMNGYIALTHYDLSEEALLSGATTLENLQHVVEQSLQLLP